jgi:hypothetical protein
VLTVGADDREIVATTPVKTFGTYRDWLVREVAPQHLDKIVGPPGFRWRARLRLSPT